VPTIAETLPGFEAVAWYGIVAPKTPKNIADKINADVNEALRQPEVQDLLRKLSAGGFLAARSKRHPDMQGDRSMGRGDQVGQCRVAVRYQMTRPARGGVHGEPRPARCGQPKLILIRRCQAVWKYGIQMLWGDQPIAIAALVRARGFHATLEGIE
jgi:hypothetical protein